MNEWINYIREMAATGKKNIHDLNRNDLRSLNSTISQITGIPLV